MKCGGVTSVTFEQYSEARCGFGESTPFRGFQQEPLPGVLPRI